MYIYIYIYIYVYTYTRYIHIYIYIHTHDIYIYIYMYTYIYTRYIYIYIRIYIYISIYTYVYTINVYSTRTVLRLGIRIVSAPVCYTYYASTDFRACIGLVHSSSAMAYARSVLFIETVDTFLFSNAMFNNKLSFIGLLEVCSGV